MIEFVFKPSRTVAGRRTVSRLFSGRFAVEKGASPITVRLNTPDREIARKRLRDIVLEKQREQEGIIAPKAVRTAAAASLGELATEYETDLRGRGLDGKHVHDSITRVRRMLTQTGWARLSDVRADAFVKWRASLACSAKTVKEYQVSACAFLNWLMRTDRLALNPLAKVDKIDVRGKQVRASRTYTEPELARLFAVAGRYAIGYQVLLYTARRWSEVYALVWGDLHLDEAEPFALFREGIGRSMAIKETMNEAKFDALEKYATNPLFDDKERAALDYVTELTKDKKVDPETFARLARHYSEREICEIVWLVASEHLYNMTNIGLNIHSDMLCDIGRRTASAN